MYLLKRTFISAIFLLLGLSTMKGTVLNSIYFEDPPKEKKDSTQSKEDSTRVNKLENKLIELSFELDNLKQKIKDGHDTTNNIGTIKMSKSVIVYKSSKEGIDMPSDTIKISHIKLYVHEGVIKELRMTTADGRLFWNKIHISLTYFERKRWYKIYQKPEKGKLKKTFESHHVLLGDIISYIPSLGTNFSAGEQTINLDSNSLTKKLKINSGINSFIEFRTYTDFLSLLDQQENGLVQLEGSAHITTNTLNYGFQRMYTFHHLKPYFKLSKFDNDYRFVKLDSSNLVPFDSSNNTPQKLNVDRSRLNQLSYLTLGLELSLLKWDFEPGSSIDFSAIWDYRFVKTKYMENKERVNYLNTYGIKAAYSLPRFQNMGMNFSLCIARQVLAGQSKFDSSNYNRIENLGGKTIMQIQFEAYYHPIKDKNNIIFFRFGTLDILQDKTGFNQVQLGYRTKLKL